jgi:ketosteroid isomerase-like protein
MAMTVDTLRQVLDAFNRHDLDGIMEYFSDDCSFDFPRGPEPYGQRFAGKAQVREGLASRFKGIPDVHYGTTGIGFPPMELREYQNGRLPEQQLPEFN